MNDSTPPPLPAPTSKLWWFAWILATVIIPGSLLLIMATIADDSALVVLYLLGAIVLALHILSSIKLGRRGSGGMTVLLLFGGWLLMGVSLFVGCVSLLSNQH